MPDFQLPDALTLLLRDEGINIWGSSYRLGRIQRSIVELRTAGMLCNELSEIAKQGYKRNFCAAPDESLLELSSSPFRALLGGCIRPKALIFHHSYASSAMLPRDEPAVEGFMPHAQYFPAALLRRFDLDGVPYFGTFATGCTGLFSLILAARGLGYLAHHDPVLCLTADVKPKGSTYDALREKILTSDCSSGFLLGTKANGYQVLGISIYSTKREFVPLVEVVKRTVQMLRNLMSALGIDNTERKFVFHYPNIFPSAWQMVSNYLQATNEPQSLEGFADRAHCLSSDPIISMAKVHRGEVGRLHVVVNFGSGLHLAVGIFKEEAQLGPSN